jgi:hypothetical protein
MLTREVHHNLGAMKIRHAMSFRGGEESRGGKERWGGGWLPEARGSQLDEGQFEQGLQSYLGRGQVCNTYYG